MLWKFKKDIFREPRKGLSWSARINLGILQIVAGCVVATLSLLNPSQSASPFYVSFEVLLGLMLVLQGVAELLPIERRMLAGGLRLGSVVLGLLAILNVVLRFLNSP